MSKIRFKSPILFIVAGKPGSGKQEFSRKLGKQLLVPSIEDFVIRKELFEQVSFSNDETAIVHNLNKLYGESILQARKSLIISGTCFTTAQRFDLIEFALKNNAEPVIVWLQQGEEAAKEKYTSSSRSHTVKSFKSQLELFEPPTDEEKPIVLSGNHAFRSQAKAVLSYLKKYELIQISDYVKASSTKSDKVSVKPTLRPLKQQPKVAPRKISNRRPTKRVLG